MTAGFGRSNDSFSYRGALALAMLLLALGGCRGCRQTPADEKADAEKRAEEDRLRKEKKPKEDFECKGPVAWPCGRYSLIEGDQFGTSNYLKPGHWTSMVMADAKMNNFDFAGDWEISVVHRGSNAQGPVPVPATPYTVRTTRQVLLAKGQAKTLESLLLVPPGCGQVSMNYQLRGRRLFEGGMPLAVMPSHQYHFVVLSRWPARYTYLSELDSIRPRHDSISVATPEAHYRVTLAPPKRQPPLPAYASLWTTIAYVLWDDSDPALWDADQRQAMLDWLHWGGQLILSGPDCAGHLAGHLLAAYLPATSAGARNLKVADLAELSAQWSGPAGRPLAPEKPWAGIRLKLDPRAQFLPDTGDLFAERAVGRGRIVVSAFRLYGAELISWPGWDGVLNGCLLRRPPRVFVDRLEGFQVHYADEHAHPDPCDPTLNSRVRIFARDAGVALAKPQPVNVPQAAGAPWPNNSPAPPGSFTAGDDPPNLGGGADLEAAAGPGVAAWNDFSPIANAARQGLQEAAGIKVLDRMFVVWIVAVYLVVLVPLNWCFFRWLGRVEWAWAAAPAIAVLCAATVINLAQLDIGFVRAQNEIAVVELHDDYPRAHVTRYMALYTSLATGYGFHFDSPGSLLLPFPTASDPKSFHMMFGESHRTLTYRRGSDADVDGFSVGSNSIGFVHGEHWIDLAHPLTISKQNGDAFQIANQTQFTLRDAGVIKKTAGGGLQTAWLGTIAAGATAAGEFGLESAAISAAELWKSERDRSPRTAASAAPGELNLRGLVTIAQDVAELRPGQIRLVGWLDDELPGLAVAPLASQSRHAALVIAHLDNGQEPMPRPDQNGPPARRPPSAGA